MTFKAVTRKPFCQSAHQPVTGHFRQNAGTSDRSLLAVASHNRALSSRPEAQGQNAIHKHKLGLFRQLLQGPEHGQFRRHPDALRIDFPC